MYAENIHMPINTRTLSEILKLTHKHLLYYSGLKYVLKMPSLTCDILIIRRGQRIKGA